MRNRRWRGSRALLHHEVLRLLPPLLELLTIVFNYAWEWLGRALMIFSGSDVQSSQTSRIFRLEVREEADSHCYHGEKTQPLNHRTRAATPHRYLPPAPASPGTQTTEQIISGRGGGIQKWSGSVMGEQVTLEWVRILMSLLGSVEPSRPFIVSWRVQKPVWFGRTNLRLSKNLHDEQNLELVNQSIYI